MRPKARSSYAHHLAHLPAQFSCVEMNRDVTKERRKQVLRQALKIRGWEPQYVRHLCGNEWCGNWGHVIGGTPQSNSLDRRFHNIHGSPHLIPAARLMRKDPACLPRLAPDGWTHGVIELFEMALSFVPDEFELRCRERCPCVVCATLRPFTRTIVDGRWTLPVVERVRNDYRLRSGVGWSRLREAA